MSSVGNRLEKSKSGTKRNISFYISNRQSLMLITITTSLMRITGDNRPSETKRLSICMILQGHVDQKLNFHALVARKNEDLKKKSKKKYIC